MEFRNLQEPDGAIAAIPTRGGLRAYEYVGGCSNYK
jgi:hypothetical protein